jgi:hypothetical protein
VQRQLIAASSANGEIISRTLHFTLVLERLVQKMAADYRFMIAIRDHLQHKRATLGITSTYEKDGFISSFLNIRQATHEIFFPLKAVTMDHVFHSFVHNRTQGFFSADHLFWSKIGVSGNILEATLTEFVSGFRENAKVGLYLMLHPHHSLNLEGGERRYEYQFKPGWEPLYESWNGAFITGNMDNLHLLYPKLLIPAVIGARQHEYMFPRALALWCSISFYLLYKAQQRPRHVLPQHQELAALWGALNAQHLASLERKRS